jgi:hypothetical protein
MRNAIVAMLTKPTTIGDMVDAGLQRGQALKTTLRDLEDEGLIESRLPNPTMKQRVYCLPGGFTLKCKTCDGVGVHSMFCSRSPNPIVEEYQT